MKLSFKKYKKQDYESRISLINEHRNNNIDFISLKSYQIKSKFLSVVHKLIIST